MNADVSKKKSKMIFISIQKKYQVAVNKKVSDFSETFLFTEFSHI